MQVLDKWEAVIFEDETCRKVRGRQAFSNENDLFDSLPVFGPMEDHMEGPVLLKCLY